MGKSSLTLTHREYLAVAIPFMISTVTQPRLFQKLKKIFHKIRIKILSFKFQ